MVALAAVVAVSLLAVGGALAVITGVGQPTVPGTDSVDAGFARDMSTHHRQAVSMAGVVRDRTTDPEIQLLAFDIETGQDAQVGMMQGWLGVWGLPVNTSAEQMSWMSGGMDMMGADGLMPGMATTGQVDELSTLAGTALDTTFLKLMIRHHRGGLPMAQYAVDHAGIAVVKQLAQKIVDTQTAEILSMQQMLRDRGGSPLPPP